MLNLNCWIIFWIVVNTLFYQGFFAKINAEDINQLDLNDLSEHHNLVQIVKKHTRVQRVLHRRFSDK